MKKITLLFPLLIMACGFIVPTPNDFPSPPPTLLTTIVEFPPVTIVPTPGTGQRVITQSDMEDARTFFMILKTQIAVGDYYGFAEKVRYPINVESEGKMRAVTSRDELAENIDSILTDKVRSAINETNEEDLILLPEGIRVGHGELWFNLFCVDAACSDTEFLITQINH